MQVDERDLVSPGQIYHRPTASYPNLFGTTTPYKILVYTPPASLTAGYTSASTYTPSDSEPDVRRQRRAVVPRQRHRQAGCGLGHRSGRRRPEHPRRGEGHRSARAVERRLRTYLFHSATLTGGSAGTTGVNYTFSLDSGDYRATYKMGTGSLSPNNTWGFNPEHSTVVTPSYSETLGDRWLNNGLAITTSGATG